MEQLSPQLSARKLHPFIGLDLTTLLAARAQQRCPLKVIRIQEKRLELGLSRVVGQRLEVTTVTDLHWEISKIEPPVAVMPAMRLSPISSEDFSWPISRLGKFGFAYLCDFASGPFVRFNSLPTPQEFPTIRQN